MPYEWSPGSDVATPHLQLWPHRSLSRYGFVWFIGITASLLALPLIAQLGTVGLWMLLPFLLATCRGLGRDPLQQPHRQRGSDPDPRQITLCHHKPGRAGQFWQADPHWVRLSIGPESRPDNYLTLTGNGREIELGAFLSPDQRLSLRDDIEAAIGRLRRQF